MREQRLESKSCRWVSCKTRNIDRSASSDAERDDKQQIPPGKSSPRSRSPSTLPSAPSTHAPPHAQLRPHVRALGLLQTLSTSPQSYCLAGSPDTQRPKQTFRHKAPPTPRVTVREAVVFGEAAGWNVSTVLGVRARDWVVNSFRQNYVLFFKVAWIFLKVFDFLLLVFKVWRKHKKWSSHPGLQWRAVAWGGA